MENLDTNAVAAGLAGSSGHITTLHDIYVGAFASSLRLYAHSGPSSIFCAIIMLRSLLPILWIQYDAFYLTQLPYYDYSDYLGGGAAGLVGAELAANDGMVFELTQALIARVVAHGTIPYY